MSKEHLEITPSTRVAEMLDNYPELEDTLIGIAPPCKKLKNPFLRKSVAKVATLKHIASLKRRDAPCSFMIIGFESARFIGIILKNPEDKLRLTPESLTWKQTNLSKQSA